MTNKKCARMYNKNHETEKTTLQKVGKGVNFVYNHINPVKRVVGAVENSISGYLENIVVNAIKDKTVDTIYSIEGLSAPHITVAVREFLYKLDPVTYDKYSIEPALDESFYTDVKPLDPCLYVVTRRNAMFIVHCRYVPNVYDKAINAFRTDIYIMGGNRKYYKNIFDNMCDHISKRLTTGNTMSVHLYEHNGLQDSVQHRKTIDSMVINSKTKEKITTKIERFIANKDEYLKHEITYKLGILLYGDPGTGKTSLAKSIACTYDCELAVINVNDILSFKDYAFNSARRNNDKMIVVLLEDIDCALNDSDDRYNEAENTKKKGTGTSRLHTLLQILDGANSSNNVIYIATTNFVDRLDEALIRDGRFDLKVEMKNFDKADAYELGHKFEFSDEELDNIFKDNKVTYPINPARLQNILLDEYMKRLKVDDTSSIDED